MVQARISFCKCAVRWYRRKSITSQSGTFSLFKTSPSTHVFTECGNTFDSNIVSAQSLTAPPAHAPAHGACLYRELAEICKVFKKIREQQTNTHTNGKAKIHTKKTKKKNKIMASVLYFSSNIRLNSFWTLLRLNSYSIVSKEKPT